MNTTWQTVSVFISSTFRDMQAERDHLVRFVFPRLREELLKRRLFFIDVDLRWGVTSEQDALAACREIIDGCHPHFLCILGGRYGWVPPGKAHSITDEEVCYAVLDRLVPALGFVHFYFRDEAATAVMVERTAGEFREPEGSHSRLRLAELKKTIVAAGLQPFSYPAQWDEESHRLAGLQEFGDRVYEDLLRSIRADPRFRDRFATDISAPLDEFAEENAAMEAFARERTASFVLGSREAVLEDLLAHACGSGSDGIICLTGAPGSGKSALLAYLSQHAAISDRPETLVIRHFAGASPGSTDVRRTLRRLCHELQAGCRGTAIDIPDDPEKLRAMFLGLLGEASAQKHVVILLDAIDRLDLGSDPAALQWLPEAPPEGARVVLSALDGPALDALRCRACRPREIELKPLTPEDGKAIVEQFLRRYQKAFEPEQRAALLGKAEAGRPLYLLAALEELRTLGNFEGITQYIADLPATTRGLFARILERLENDEGFRDATGRRVGCTLVPQFAALLGVSRNGLRQQELADLLDPGDPQGNLAALLRLLRPYLMHRAELIDFYHGEFRAAAQAAWLQSEAQRQAAHARLALYFQARLGQPTQRTLTELLYHLAAAGLDDELLGITWAVPYLEQFTAQLGIGQLLETLNQARAALLPGSAAVEPLAQQLEILQRESGSLAEWSAEKRVPDLYSQLVNSAVRRGYHQLAQRLQQGEGGFPGSILLQWSLGPREADIKERLVVEGTRDSYSWDIYDYGPLGCRTKVWVDLGRHRLLTDTVSTYGSLEHESFQQTHAPAEWDLLTGALLAKHDAETDEWDAMKAMPRAFQARSGLATMRKVTVVPRALASAMAEGGPQVRATVVGGAVLGTEIVVAVTTQKRGPIYGPDAETWLWVCDPITDRVYRTSHQADGLEIQAIIKLENGLTAFATDDDGHVYRLLLVAREAPSEEPPVLDAALGETPGEFACIRPSGVEMRAVADCSLSRAYRPEDLCDKRMVITKGEPTEGRSPEEYDLRWTPDRQWLTVDRRSEQRPHVFPATGCLALHDGFLSAESGDWLRREWVVESMPVGRRNDHIDPVRWTTSTRFGKYRLGCRRCSIDVWDVQSGRWVGKLGPGPRYGGGGSLYGLASHPTERFVISSDDEVGGLVVWDLEKNLESWRLQGLGPLGKVSRLEFLWGGYLVAVLTEGHMLYLVRFWWQSEIVGAIRVDRGATRIIGMTYGDRVFVLYEGGRLGCYRYVPHPGAGVTAIEGASLVVRARMPGAKEVHVAGTFNSWSPSASPLATDDGEHWRARLQLAPGRYEYKLVIDGFRWELDPNVPFVPGPYGPNNYVDLPS